MLCNTLRLPSLPTRLARSPTRLWPRRLRSSSSCFLHLRFPWRVWSNTIIPLGRWQPSPHPSVHSMTAINGDSLVTRTRFVSGPFELDTRATGLHLHSTLTDPACRRVAVSDAAAPASAYSYSARTRSVGHSLVARRYSSDSAFGSRVRMRLAGSIACSGILLA